MYVFDVIVVGLCMEGVLYIHTYIHTSDIHRQILSNQRHNTNSYIKSKQH